MTSGSGDRRSSTYGSRYHVVPSGSSWVVKSDAGEPAVRKYESRAEAVQAAKEAVGRKGGQLIVHAKDGRALESFTLGRDPFGRIGEVEGIFSTSAAKARAAEYDRRGLSSDERRGAIIEAYRRKG